MFFSLEEFRKWRNQHGNRVCVYCGNNNELLFSLGIENVRTGKRYEVIGVDRLDNAKPYTLKNIVPCCGPCNAIRGGILSHHEMISLSEPLRRLWDARILSVKNAQSSAKGV